MSIATGSVQFTNTEKMPRSAYATKGPVGHDAPNVGGCMSKKVGNPLRLQNRQSVRYIS